MAVEIWCYMSDNKSVQIELSPEAYVIAEQAASNTGDTVFASFQLK